VVFGPAYYHYHGHYGGHYGYGYAPRPVVFRKKLIVLGFRSFHAAIGSSRYS
jgi:hypothetical protein